MGHWGRKAVAILLTAGLILSSAAAPVGAADILQCVPYARVVSGVNLHGDAWTWWSQAAGLYDRGHRPSKGAVLAFQPYGAMQLGHVAVVSRVLSDRQVLIRHANWSTPGRIEEDVLAVDVSDAGDWSAVRVWYSPTQQMGSRVNPTFGFIYPKHARLEPFRGESTEAKVQRALFTPNGPRRAPVLQVVADGADDDAIIAPTRRDPNFIVEYADPPTRFAHASDSGRDRSLGDIIAEVKRDANIR